MSTFRSFLKQIIHFFCTPKNRSFRFVFKMEKIVQQKNKSFALKYCIIETKSFLYFRFCFYSFLQKAWANCNLSFRYLFSSKSKLYLFCFSLGSEKKLFVRLGFMNKILFSSKNVNILLSIKKTFIFLKFLWRFKRRGSIRDFGDTPPPSQMQNIHNYIFIQGS